MTVQVLAVDLKNGPISKSWLELLDHYAADPMGGGSGLSSYAREHLVERLRELPGFHGALAWEEGQPVGLINGFLGFSTFAAQPLLNIHDVVTRRDCRGRGIAQALLAWAAQRARELGCCKLTLEVLSQNRRALASYERAGFVPYVLDPQAGHALLMQKILTENDA